MKRKNKDKTGSLKALLEKRLPDQTAAMEEVHSSVEKLHRMAAELDEPVYTTSRWLKNTC
ncbi:hypothetical protein [Desulforamulus putei]|uniref:hypothetical protein n=1 Tax=Desulforamulus putei TaxID=74701 RepID=UPI001160112B|nr:hypothetical protein [Desulforamulus putei]